MTMTKRARSKRLRKSEHLLGAGTEGQGYGTGVIGPDPRRTDLLLVLVFAVSIALSFIFFRVILIPGVLLIAAIHGAIDRPASVAVTNRGIAILARSEFNGRPRKVLTVLPHGILTDGTVQRSGSYVHLPNFHLWFRKKEYERLLVAVGTRSVASHLPPPVVLRVGAPMPGGPGPAFATPNGAVAIAPPPAPPTSQSDVAGDVIYCSWCGKQRAVNAQALHYCGSMERPVAYCMKCGTSVAEGAAACASCGTPATQTSR